MATEDTQRQLFRLLRCSIDNLDLDLLRRSHEGPIFSVDSYPSEEIHDHIACPAKARDVLDS